MKYLKYLIIVFSLVVNSTFSQSVIDISDETEIEIGDGAEVCADIQTGNGIISGPGTFCGGTLPVELSAFTFSILNRDVILQWSTAYESNNSGFDIERSERKGQTPENWIKAGSVQGNGSVNFPSDYEFTDRNLSAGKYKYRLKQIDLNGNFEYFHLENEINIGSPEKFYLSQNFPNPFNPSTQINYDIPVEGNVSLKVFDMTGKEIITLIDKRQNPGYYSINFNAGNLTTGMYFYKLIFEGSNNSFTAVKKMMLVK